MVTQRGVCRSSHWKQQNRLAYLSSSTLPTEMDSWSTRPGFDDDCLQFFITSIFYHHHTQLIKRLHFYTTPPPPLSVDLITKQCLFINDFLIVVRSFFSCLISLHLKLNVMLNRSVSVFI